jgi:short-subunit dehydrogenase
MTKGFAERYGQWAIVAGASEGVGAAAADQLAARGLNVVLLARNAGLLDELATDLRARHGVEIRTLAVDFMDADAADRILAVVDGLEIGLLFYNAGAAGSTGAFLDQDLSHARRMVRLNCALPVELIHALAPRMVERGRGGLVLVGSMGCFAGQPFVTSYSASKAFQVNLMEGLWAELKDEGVDVLSAVIGSTFTPARARRLGVTFDDALDMTSEEVANEIIEHIGDGPTRVVAKLTGAFGSLAAPWSQFRATAVATMVDAMAGFKARTTN